MHDTTAHAEDVEGKLQPPARLPISGNASRIPRTCGAVPIPSPASAHAPETGDRSRAPAAPTVPTAGTHRSDPSHRRPAYVQHPAADDLAAHPVVAYPFVDPGGPPGIAHELRLPSGLLPARARPQHQRATSSCRGPAIAHQRRPDRSGFKPVGAALNWMLASCITERFSTRSSRRCGEGLGVRDNDTDPSLHPLSDVPECHGWIEGTWKCSRSGALDASIAGVFGAACDGASLTGTSRAAPQVAMPRARSGGSRRRDRSLGAPSD